MLFDLNGGMNDLNYALEINPSDPASHFSRGFCFSRKGEWDKAIADYDQAIKLDAAYNEVYRERGFAWAIKGDYQKAFVDLDRAVSLLKKEPSAWVRRGYAYTRQGESAKAIADFSEAIKLDAMDGEPRFRRAIAYAMQNGMDKAMADYKEVFRLDPRPVENYKQWGPAADHDSRVKMVDRLEAELKKSQPEGNAHFLQGIALQKAEKYKEAIAEYDQSLLAYPAARKCITIAGWPFGSWTSLTGRSRITRRRSCWIRVL